MAMGDHDLVEILEGALLAADEPLTKKQLAQLLDELDRPSTSDIATALDEVSSRCEGRGFELVEVASGFRFQVRQHLSPWVSKLWVERPARYSRALLETLSLIAYRQPITRGEIEDIRDKVKGFTGVISDLGGPTANMYRLGCKSPEIESACRKPSCVFPGICSNLTTDHGPLIQMYRKARSLKGIKKILIGSGLRYDLAVQSPEYVKELVTHHVGGYLKIAPEHTESGPLTKMMKPGIGSYDKFKSMFDKFSAEAGKKQFLVPYFIAAHPGTSDEDMMNLAIWLKKNGFRADQVQTFYPSPMATATAMYHTTKNPLRKITRDSEKVDVVKGGLELAAHWRRQFIAHHA